MFVIIEVCRKAFIILHSQGDSSNILWILIDNGFCICFYLIVSAISIIKKLTGLDEEDDIILVFFHTVLFFVHSFICIAFKVIYDDLKNQAEVARATDEYDYGKTIDKEVI